MPDDAIPKVLLPRTRLDGLLDELQTHLDGVRETRDRISTLLDAVLSVGGDLDLETVLRRIVESAVVLVDAEYGALGVIGEEESLDRFLTVGMDEETIAGIGPYPAGEGILGLVISNPHALRLHDLNTHQDAYGFPPGHPPMRTFLGVPIRTRNEVYGNIYLTEKRGGGDFDEEDEVLLRALATAAGVAIDNARLYDEARNRERRLAAGSELTRSLLSGDDPVEVLQGFTATVQEMSGADLVAVVAPLPGTDDLVVTAASGTQADRARGRVLPRTPTLADKVYRSGEMFVSSDVGADPRGEGSLVASLGLGPVFIIPLGTHGHIRGVLQVANTSGRADFTATVVRMVTGFADHAALALEIAERRRDAELLTVFQERDRIARDLHDLAIQRLFATGMTLESALPQIDNPAAAERVTRAVDDLDETIKVIRSTIFSLKARDRTDKTGLRGRILRETDKATDALGFGPTLRLDGLLDTLVPDSLADDVIAALREALSNVTRHAGASRVDVAAEAADGLLRLWVTDDGVGISAGREGTGRGLDNLRARAETAGGRCTVAGGESGGTVVEWAAPLPDYSG